MEDSGSVDAMIGMLQEQLKRNGFDEFTSIEHQCMHFDINRFTTLPATLVKKSKIKELLRCFFSGSAPYELN